MGASLVTNAMKLEVVMPRLAFASTI
jgi:hypothetical protein